MSGRAPDREGTHRLPGGGVERWRAEWREGALEARSRILRDGTEAAVETVRLVCGEDLAPRALYVAVRDRAGWRTLEALAGRGTNGGWLVVLVDAPDGERIRRDLDLPAGASVDYPSPALEALMLERLGLAAGEAREVPVLRVEVPSLAASAARRRYVG